MMSGFVEHIINNPQTRYRSAKQVGLKMLSEHQRGESCGLGRRPRYFSSLAWSLSLVRIVTQGERTEGVSFRQ